MNSVYGYNFGDVVEFAIVDEVSCKSDSCGYMRRYRRSYYHNIGKGDATYNAVVRFRQHSLE